MRSLLYFLVPLLLFSCANAQVSCFEFNSDTEKTFTPYMLWKHGGTGGLAEFKMNEPHTYLKELWYYSRSFYIKRNHFTEGVVLDEAIIDVSRYEDKRSDEQKVMVVLEGFKDVMILLPANELIYKP